MARTEQPFSLDEDEQEVCKVLKKYGVDGIDSVIEEADLAFSSIGDLTGKELEKVLMLLEGCGEDEQEKILEIYGVVTSIRQ